MKAFFKNILSTIIGIVVSVIVLMVLFVGIIAVALNSSDQEITVKENSILKIDLTKTAVV